MSKIVQLTMNGYALSEDPDRIVVRKDTIARCTWCGSPESNKWISAQNDDIYCSSECMEAATMGKRKAAAGVSICCGVTPTLIFAIAIVTSNYSLAAGASVLFTVGFANLICGLVLYFGANEGKKYQDRKGKFSGISPIECEYCMHSNPPSATRCLNCDATLSRAHFLSEAVPPWIHKYKKTKGMRCPHCNAIYSYTGSQISDEGQVACQNCIRLFSVPNFPMNPSPEMKRAQY